MKKEFALMGFVSVAVLGCVSPSRHSEAELRRFEALGERARAIQVFVVADDESEDISVDEEPIHRKKNNKKDIDFTLNAPAGYAFAATGITWDDPRQAPPAGEVTCTTVSPTSINCSNQHKFHQRKYKYTLHVINPSGQELTVDPFINNH